MQTTAVEFFSEGERIAALWRTPDAATGPLKVLVQGPGWLGLKDAKLYVRYHEALTEAGYGILVIDYRGFGDSGGARELSPAKQLQDLVNAVTYLTTREDVDADAIGTFGTGGTGGGNSILLAHVDPRVRAVVSQVPVADGRDWLHRMRSESDWLAFLNALEEDRRQRVATGEGRRVHPREEIMVPTAERRTTTVKADVDDRIPSSVSLAAADEILQYKPLDAARRLTTPLLVIGVEGDATTPTDHATALYEAAQGPRRLVMQRHTTHYAAYDRYWTTVTPLIVDWFDTHLRNGGVVVRSGDGLPDTIELREDS
ncbi:alpha/beta fold hydrolase [Solirubrobacter sp. CPCC 204708]|uniref:Alpha/beta fold hydrolase n=1 Tax=Solirubrobacter deserti TaxID=2282478 RepID=A0ABT4RFB3_9ACTN|nr:CocE/NonD family hydrolase [Solirubrobacter deserti]MBE2319494.1 alpha/beta fold hydrolase [Solirubrobacter deserti]MDA0137219.1 alpha/beta fold hydrolase [Solirubrobacter deserti]